MRVIADQALLLEAKAAWTQNSNLLADWSNNTCPCGSGMSRIDTWTGVDRCADGRVTRL
jgi:hypothetical protein